jgi:hypothetical protein
MDAAGNEFVRGAVRYHGEQHPPFTDNLGAVLISALWESS